MARLREEGFSTAGLFYNPNIHPFQEHAKRLSSARELFRRVGLPFAVHDGYDLDAFLLRVAGKGTGRCEACYRFRLDVAAAEAKAGGYTLFTTSLLYSKRQKHDLIRGVAREIAGAHGIELYYEDFRAGWRRGIEESRALGLYRQKYCGCLYSEHERYGERAGAGSAQHDEKEPRNFMNGRDR
jgi:predicted adenine nucleotide alpha hydrolase (AANH) superfamily ATPase